jgi:hypothetical protein
MSYSKPTKTLTAGLLGILLVTPASGDLSTKNQSIPNVSVGYRIPCDGIESQLNLGTVSISLANAESSSEMNATLSVGASARNHEIWDCMELHWLQIITLDADPTPYFGRTDYNLPIIDPPKGGWDYMYTDGATRKNPKPSFDISIDDAPWYYSVVGEAEHYTIGQTYSLRDLPGDPRQGSTQFATYLMAVPTQTCTPQSPECLSPGEMLLLGGFNWLVSSTTIVLFGTFTAPSPHNVVDIQSALGNSGFSGWTVRDSDLICCVPEPHALGLVAIAICMAGLATASRRPCGIGQKGGHCRR